MHLLPAAHQHLPSMSSSLVNQLLLHVLKLAWSLGLPQVKWLAPNVWMQIYYWMDLLLNKYFYVKAVHGSALSYLKQILKNYDLNPELNRIYVW